MSKQITINAKARNDLGKGASRRLRLTGEVPAVVYGSGEAQSLSLIHKDLWKAQEAEHFYASVLTLDIDGKTTPVIIKDLQRHPAKNVIMHADFQRAEGDTIIEMNVPLHYTNTTTCVGVKTQGGSLELDAKLVHIACKAKDLPEFLEIDMLERVVGDIIHLSDINFPEGVESTDLRLGADHDLPLAKVTAARG
ncbi:50S ribosomal protein L25 [BD1-7 clade bacterium]|uniref:Large ribosomal subunit protein bL25 n=1 Tax=BD1-7 clade bacterium TaxID=2029982 RepID=A0A5S9N6S1_9GAMM|nr:50S ribosomal protein L25 [BD1-7 clade bacterium]CAA0084654.1 50S ribosomal protein L25 [BD1-7 clade bacterium]